MEKEKRKGKRSSILIIIIFLIGLSLLLYPSIGDFINYRKASETVKESTKIASEMPEEEKEEIFSFAEEYNRMLFETEDSFYVPSLISGYESALDITGTGIMGYLKIDSIDVELPIYHTVDEMVLQVGVGHLPGSSLPVGGQNTHAVLSGHRGIPSSKLFTDLDKVQIDDTFTITVLDRVLTYKVDQIKTVLPRDVSDLQIVPGMDYCTLLTCTPYGVNTHRLLVRGVRQDVDYEPIVTDENQQTETTETTLSVTTRTPVQTEIAEDGTPIIYVANEAFRIETFIVMAILAVPMLIIMLIYQLIREIAVRIIRIFRHNKHNAIDRKTNDENSDNEKTD
ncbi:MAG: class C sortase [Ruminococcus sp.]|nr:class C sortase [Ruminococcus sp.]